VTSVQNTQYYVVLFDSVSHAMKAEKILKTRGVVHKIIPVPKEISSDCGVCIRFEKDSVDEITSALSGQVDVRQYRPL